MIYAIMHTNFNRIDINKYNMQVSVYLYEIPWTRYNFKISTQSRFLDFLADTLDELTRPLHLNPFQNGSNWLQKNPFHDFFMTC